MRAIATRMAPALTALLCLAGTLALVACAAGARMADAGHTYTVAQVRTLLAHHSTTWTGRTIQVRGVVARCPIGYPALCATWQPTLRDARPRPSEAGVGLLLAYNPARPDTLTALLRRIPWLRMMARGLQAVQWDVAATYQIQLQPVSGSHCGGAPCYEALLVDGAP